VGSHETRNRMNYDALGLADRQSRYEYSLFFKLARRKGDFPLPRVSKGGSIKYPGGVEDISGAAVAGKEGQRALIT